MYDATSGCAVGSDQALTYKAGERSRHSEKDHCAFTRLRGCLSHQIIPCILTVPKWSLNVDFGDQIKIKGARVYARVKVFVCLLVC